MTAADLKAKCEALAAAGDAQAQATLKLFARVKELEDGLRLFAKWYDKYGPDEIHTNAVAVAVFCRGAELLKGDS
jgi:hypothetical protein